jgi:hypothetical protein
MDINSHFAKEFPAISTSDDWTDRVICQGHADYCEEYGHAKHTVNGIVQDRCPRCGDSRNEPTFDISSEDAAKLNTAIRGLVEAVQAEIRAAEQKGYSAGYTAFCSARSSVEDQSLSRRQYRAYVLNVTGRPVPQFVTLGVGVSA